ncbi:MAG: diguanylate cyclase [Lachnospiraceae bacterium]|nr:diguanylate cyclase [Lachnospiraceae bacterium]
MDNRSDHSFATIWANLNKPIYTGDRLRSNIRALTFVSIVGASLGLIMLILNISLHDPSLIFASTCSVIAGVGCGFSAHVLKNRDLAVWFPMVFCVLFCTIYIFTGAAQGSAILWSIMIPIGVSYFVSVKYGIIVAGYYTVLYIIVFYTPLNARFSAIYTSEFMVRFPLMYAGLSLFTEMAMVQYHRTVLFEIDHANLLAEEVERQTAMIKEQSQKIEKMSFQTIQALSNAIDAKDSYTKGHSYRVSRYSELIARALSWDETRVQELEYAALLHDIGKIGIPDSILTSPRALTDIEADIIRSHTTMGRDMLKDRILINMADDVALSHHERYDGTGYPQGLKGKEISEEARIVAIADAFDAMSSDRAYRKAYDTAYIRKELTEGMGEQFDPDIVPVFIKLWDEGYLNGILKDNKPEKVEGGEVSSVLLREVVESFVTQNAKDDKDITTGIMGRSAGESAIAQMMKTSAGCFAFMDIDNLKKINDTYGHEAGDRVLHIMGETLKQNSEGALCCRLGGDEFILFIKDVTKKDAAERIEKIFSDFEEHKKDDIELSPASISAGLVMCSPDSTYTDTYNRADKALYHVKSTGKRDYGFYHEETEDDDGDIIDVRKLLNSIKQSGSYRGAMSVEYREFTRLYEFVNNLKQRFAYSFKLIVISLEAIDNENVGMAEFERSMANMEQSLRRTIRDVDVMTRYGNRQFLVIMLGTDSDGVRTAVNRIFRDYYKMPGAGILIPSYSFADIDDL